MRKYDSLNGIRAYAAIAILAMHVLENSEYTNIANSFVAKVDLLNEMVDLFIYDYKRFFFVLWIL